MGEKRTILAVDYGAAWCGLAFSLAGKSVVTSGNIRTENLLSELQKRLHEQPITDLVFGLPISDDGTENQNCAEIRRLGALFSYKVAVHYVPERNSTIHRRAERTDDASAALILNWFLRQKK